MVTARTYRGLTTEQRRDQRRSALIEAGLDLLGTEGVATVTAVCARAGLTERYFYENFRDLDELSLAVLDHIRGIAVEAVLGAVLAAPDDARAKARAAIASFVELTVDDPRLAKVGFIVARGNEAMARSVQVGVRQFARLISATGRDFYGHEAVDEKLVDVASVMLAGGLFETLVLWLQGDLDLTRDELIEHCTDVFFIVGDTLARRTLSVGRVISG